MKHYIFRVLLLFLFCRRTRVEAELGDKVEVIVDSSPCSSTCGLGLKNQTLCFLKDSRTALEEGAAEVSEECRVRTVKCQEAWRCGLMTQTVTAGQRVELNCLGEVMKAMGRFSWRVSWRYARGIISSDNTLFTQWNAALLDRVVLDPIREEDAGTYRCDVQDISFRRVKRFYWGIRVLPIGILNLDYDSSLAQWNLSEKQQTQSVSDQPGLLYYTVLIGLNIAIFVAGLILLVLYLIKKNIIHQNSDVSQL